MSRRRGKGLRDMNQPTISDVRGAVDEACRYCEDAEAWADDARAARDATRSGRRYLVALGAVQILVITVELSILVTR